MLVSGILIAVVQGFILGGPFIRGDSNGDRSVDLSDAISTIQDLFLGGPQLACRDAGDFNDDGALDIADVSGTLNFLFLNGDPSPSPGPWGAGWDATPGDPFTCGDFPAEISLDEEEMFDRLTRAPWHTRQPPNSPFGTSYDYRFRRDGTYDWLIFSDYPEGSGKGHWNFLKTTAGGGMLILEDGKFLRFSFTADGRFWLAHLTFEPDQGPICPDGPCCEVCTRSGLPDVPIPATVDLLAGRWRRTDDFNTIWNPTTIEFGGDGTYAAIFRDGACGTSGFWSLLGESYFISAVLGETCDSRLGRIGGPLYSGGRFKWEGGALVFDNLDFFLPDAGPTAEGSFRIMVGPRHANGDAGHIEVTYPRPLARGRDQFRFLLTAGESLIEPWTLLVTGTPIKFSGSSSAFSGEKEVLGGIDLPALEPRGSFGFSLDLDLRGDDDLWLEFVAEGNDLIWLDAGVRILSR